MKAVISIQIETDDQKQAVEVKKTFETMNTHFGASGIIKMRKLFLNDPFIRNLVKMKINKK